jgi:hypothetical protein
MRPVRAQQIFLSIFSNLADVEALGGRACRFTSDQLIFTAISAAS